jgi:hypothetical protein
MIMSAASDLIERLEKETGQRIDDNNGDNLAMAGLLGAISREMGYSPPTYQERDDVKAGLLIKHQASPEYAAEQKTKEMTALLLGAGIPLEDAIALIGNGRPRNARASHPDDD